MDKTTSATLLDRATICLERRRAQLGAVVELLPRVDARAAPRVMEAIAGLPGLEPCRDHEALLDAMPPPDDPAVVAGIAEVRDRLDRSLTTERLGNLDDALELAQEGVRRAQALEYRPIQAEAAYALGVLHVTRRELDDAVAQLDEALWLAEAGGHDELVAQSASRLVVAYSIHGQLDLARAQARRARAAIERLGRATQAEVVLHSGLGHVARLEGKLEEARDAYARALEYAEQLDEEPVWLGGHVDNLASTYAALGDHERGLALLEHAYELKRSGLGELHPSVLWTRLNMSTARLASGDLDRAVADLQAVGDLAAATEAAQRALQTAPSHGPQSELALARGHFALADCLAAQGQPVEAEDHARSALAGYERIGDDEAVQELRTWLDEHPAP